MEKLIVKNFGPIKEAEIELNKYVVFIGDTSTGKSVLAKLISIFREFSNVLNNKVENIDLERVLDFNNQLKNYNIDFGYNNSTLDFFEINLHLQLFENKIKIIKDDRDKYSINDLDPGIGGINASDLQKIFGKIGVKGKSIYFPAERILTSLIGSSISGLWANNVALPNCFKNFAATYEVARKDVIFGLYSSFGFDYVFENGDDYIITNGGKFSLTQASSGIQSLLPLLLVLDYELKVDYIKPDLCFLIEEPELNLFPIKQKMLIDHLSSRISNTKHRIIITTHSPYILSSLDTLMLAKNTFNEHPNLKEEINAIVSEDKWIDYEDISVYEVRNDGKVYSIKNEEFRSIDTNAIDSVSDIISEEFDKLTSLRYAQ